MDGLKHIPLSVVAEAAVTTMRSGDQFGTGADELLNGNVIPRLCQAAGEGACAKVCQLVGVQRQEAGVECAENNIASVIDSVYTVPERFALVAATKDNVKFADTEDSATNPEGYKQVADCNAFFFRPGIDGLSHMAMRMADCGSVMYQFNDKNGDLVLGQAHFSRTNMKGPSAYAHEVDAKKVSWSEYVLANAAGHYQIDPKTISVTLVAAVEGKDFIHHYATPGDMEAHYPGWAELGFLHPESDADFDCLIDYRQMIEWQLSTGIADPALALDPAKIKTDNAINTGDISLGHSSHHHATKGTIAHGRDMYVVGVNVQNLEHSYRTTRQLQEENYLAGYDDYAQADQKDIDQIVAILGYIPRL
jgi:hypothetical protein